MFRIGNSDFIDNKDRGCTHRSEGINDEFTEIKARLKAENQYRCGLAE